MVGSILHLGNIDFDDSNFNETSTPCSLKGEENAKIGCDLLKIDFNDLKKALLFKVIEMKVGNEVNIIEK